MLRLKDGVRLANLQPQAVLAITVAVTVWGDEDLTITSANDSIHSKTSLHYAGAAFDIRTNGITDPDGKAILLEEALGIDYDVIYETDHIHVEYQPRR